MKKTYTCITINGKKIYLHRHLMQIKLRRELETFEHVYHLNGDSKDNRIENLVLIVKNHNKR